jgi:excisionase family DNA binding protein
MDKHRLLTITEAAARLGIEQKTLRRWADAGRVPHVRTFGGQRRFEPATIDRIRKEMGFTDVPTRPDPDNFDDYDDERDLRARTPPTP